MMSMTGFGSGEAVAGPVTVTVELRSVNHRFLDASIKLPGSLQFLEIDLRNRLKDGIARGRVTCAATATIDPAASAPRLEPGRLDAALALLLDAAARVERQTGEPQDVTLDHLLRVPDLFTPAQAELSRDDLQAAFFTAFDRALAGLQAMKRQEGSKLVTEMQDRLAAIADGLVEVRALAPRAAEEAHRKLSERLMELIGSEVDPQRLAQEAAFLADKANINEECERLAIHLQHARDDLAAGGQVAKRLNFLLQEMHREVNTMGAKTNLMEITQLVIGMKDEVESLREQVQNLE
ncbi:MAG TPA: YicC family protein [Candidatus Krumholzibacteria bacterium]|nr:YicC family protein [Candidatus Krumholzibacteria bacterium]HPD71960.1 YicC family protein [Candidatus Krumholzibacteria bacterium]HRY41107.1 YicC family protein [Candidatus Krumholzibacteria bacterium]